MSLDKAIEHGKEKRKQYRGAKKVDRGCRNHGSCSYCSSSRQLKNTRGRYTQNEALEAYYNQVCERPV